MSNRLSRGVYYYTSKYGEPIFSAVLGHLDSSSSRVGLARASRSPNLKAKGGMISKSHRRHRDEHSRHQNRNAQRKQADDIKAAVRWSEKECRRYQPPHFVPRTRRQDRSRIAYAYAKPNKGKWYSSYGRILKVREVVWLTERRWQNLDMGRGTKQVKMPKEAKQRERLIGTGHKQATHRGLLAKLDTG
jgi:hypothetical protein